MTTHHQASRLDAGCMSHGHGAEFPKRSVRVGAGYIVLRDHHARLSAFWGLLRHDPNSPNYPSNYKAGGVRGPGQHQLLISPRSLHKPEPGTLYAATEPVRGAVDDRERCRVCRAKTQSNPALVIPSFSARTRWGYHAPQLGKDPSRRLGREVTLLSSAHGNTAGSGDSPDIREMGTLSRFGLQTGGRTVTADEV
ncbi:hypothetical protein G7Z17_g3886 [Cylindrodendrum hubeiense]|uniref:Uncharacterized protein n=1 Tax=Cylindrodendrum hubeiense TaxID=595255 RepID=A0A9P5HDT5_9HYPO|nr:hypothetical protein G7Z17_g3886 [Cylindrodendrum hubeiense]